jgi:hypothetical protein
LPRHGRSPIVTDVAGAVEFVNVTLDAPTLYLFPARIALVSVVLLVRRPQIAPRDSAGS